MKLHPRVTQTAVDLAKRFEGFRPRAGKTPDGRYTIGYGHILGSRDKPDQVEISEAEAEFLLKLDLSRVAEEIEPALLAPVNDNQFAALLSFALNIGTDNFKGCSALRRLNEGAYLQAAAAIELWRRADFDGETLVVDQLVRRRAVEKALFLAPPEGFTPVPSAVLRPTFDHSVIGAAVAWAAARERTAVSRLALEGPEVSAGLAVPPGREGEPAPSAAIAAADALTARLSRILPENLPEPEDARPPAPEPLALQAEPAPPEPPEPVAAAPAPLDLEAPPRPASWTRQSFTQPSALIPDVNATLAPKPDAVAEAKADDAPPAPAAVDEPPASNCSPLDEPLFEAANAEPAAFAPAPALSFDDPIFDTPAVAAHNTPAQVEEAASPEAPAAEPEPAADTQALPAPPLWSDASASAIVEPRPVVEPDDESASASDASPFRRRFGARIASAMQTVAAPAPSQAPAEAPSLFDAPARPAAFEMGMASAPEVAATPAPVTPLFERPAFFFGLGLLGVALFAGSIFCMLNKASFTCLLIGVVGVLAMAPAAAFFLFRFLGAPVDHTHDEHADMLSMMQEPAPAAASAVETHAEEPVASAFDRAEWR